MHTCLLCTYNTQPQWQKTENLTRTIITQTSMIQARREPQRGRGNNIAGPITLPPPHSVCLEIDTSKASRGGEVGRGERCPLTIRLGVRGSVVSSPRGVRGGAPNENGFYAYFRSERSHLEHNFQYFWATAGPPNVAGPGKTFPPFLPSQRACTNTHCN